MFKSINGGILPQRATKYSAGFDVFANEDVTIGAGETALIGLGIALEDQAIQDEWFKHFPNCADYRTGTFLNAFYFALHIRSSLRAKGLTSLGTGIIDMDYRDEIKMVIHNPIKFPSKAKEVFNECNSENDFMRIVSNVTAIVRTMFSNNVYHIKKGDKIGQLILCLHEGWLLPSEYTKDEERQGGFGSTGNE